MHDGDGSIWAVFQTIYLIKAACSANTMSKLATAISKEKTEKQGEVKLLENSDGQPLHLPLQ